MKFAAQRTSRSHLAVLEMIPMSEGLPRLLLTLTLLVAAGVLFLGIKDYIQQKNPKPSPSVSTSTLVDSKTEAAQKKTTSLKARRARTSTTEADVHATAQAAADDTEKPLIRKESPKTGGKGVLANNDESNAVTAANQDQEAAIGQDNNGVGKEV